MFSDKRRQQRSERGFSLVEIMVAVVIGMLGILIIMQVFLVFEGQKRTTTGGADAQENALMALFTTEREMRMSGLGLVGLGCNTIQAYNANMMPQQNYVFNAWPVTIDRDKTRDAAGNLVPAAGTDMITLLYSASAFGNIPTTITTAMPTRSAILNVNNGVGFSGPTPTTPGDLFIVSQPGQPCSLGQASQNGQQTGATWNLQHNSGDDSPYNSAGGLNPPGGYGAGARVTNMGNMVNHEFFVQNNNLMMRDVNLPQVVGINPVALVNGIFAIRAQYGRDTLPAPPATPDGYVDVWDNTAPTSAAEVVAIRLAVVARSGQFEKDDVSPANLDLWPGASLANGGRLPLLPQDRKYRYKIYQTTIPLRNVIWNN